MIDIYRNALFGDGHITNPNKKGNVQLIFSSTVKSNIELKASILNSNVLLKPQHKNAYGKKDIYHTSKTVLYKPMNKLEQINKLTLEDLFLWLIDDGSRHKTKGFMNLNSHALTQAENIELSSYLFNTFDIESKVYPDKKKDGRVFWYLCIPRYSFESIIEEFREFIITHNLYGYEYKVGLTSQTIGYTK